MADQGLCSTPLRQVTRLATLSSTDIRPSGVYILDNLLEFYVLIGPSARDQRTNIRLALQVASELALSAQKRRGGRYAMLPPVHCLVFPSLAPREVRAAIRYWDDEHLVSGFAVRGWNMERESDLSRGFRTLFRNAANGRTRTHRNEYPSFARCTDRGELLLARNATCGLFLTPPHFVLALPFPFTQLDQRTFAASSLADPTCLPLGLAPSDLPGYVAAEL